MARNFVTGAVVVLVLLTSAQAVADDPTPAEVQADCAQIVELCQKYSDSFEGCYGNTMVYSGKAEEAQKALDQVQMIEKDILPVLQPVMAAFSERYGTSAMDINNKINKMNVEVDGNPGNRFDDLYRNVENVYKSRLTSAEFIANNAKQSLDHLDRLKPDLQARKLEEAKALLLVGHGFDPNNAAINQQLGTIDEQIDAVVEKQAADLDAANWAGNISDFAGPGEAPALAKTAREFFAKHPNWTGDAEKGVEILAVSVQGQWQVAETNILGSVVSWRLPIHMAMTNKELRPQNVARVYELSIVTFKGEPGKVAKAPPFEGYWVGDNYLMKLDRLP